MIQLDKKTLRKLQMNQMELLKEFKRICEKNNINYNLIGGTMLGAVRHQGYIPWDDDADVGLLRPDYESFREACASDLDDSRFYFQDDRNTPGYRWGYGKLRLRNTLFLREAQEHMDFEQGVFIDVFPLDSVPDGWLARRLNCFHCFCIRKILWSAVGRRTDRRVLARLLYRLLYRIPKQRVFRHYYGMVKKNNLRKTRCVRILMFPATKSLGLDRTLFENNEDILFEGVRFRGPADYDAYLTEKYGDYMEIPPEDKRKTHPVSAIELLETTQEGRRCLDGGKKEEGSDYRRDKGNRPGNR